MADLSTIPVRNARDRLIEMLGIGHPYPLQDVAVETVQPMVALKTTAKIQIEDSQQDVLYQLREPTAKQGEKGVGDPVQGNGDTIQLETYPIHDDVIFRILAIKQASGNAAYLH